MRRFLLLAALIVPLLTGCEPTAPGTESAIGFAMIEGTATNSSGVHLANSPITYSCGPGLFGGSTSTDAAGKYQITLRFPDSLRTDLPDDRRLGCLVQIPDHPEPSRALAVPIVTFAEKANETQPVRADFKIYSPAVAGGGQTRDNVLVELAMGEVNNLRPITPCGSRCSYFGIPLHHENVSTTPTFSGQGQSISITGLTAGTTTILMYGIRHSEWNTPDGWKVGADTSMIGAIGVRVR